MIVLEMLELSDLPRYCLIRNGVAGYVERFKEKGFSPKMTGIRDTSCHQSIRITIPSRQAIITDRSSTTTTTTATTTTSIVEKSPVIIKQTALKKRQRGVERERERQRERRRMSFNFIFRERYHFKIGQFAFLSRKFL